MTSDNYWFFQSDETALDDRRKPDIGQSEGFNYLIIYFICIAEIKHMFIQKEKYSKNYKIEIVPKQNNNIQN